jgi:hypothetical protein
LATADETVLNSVTYANFTDRLAHFSPTGKLHAYDQHLNMVIGNADETVTTTDIDEDTLEETVRHARLFIIVVLTVLFDSLRVTRDFLAFVFLGLTVLLPRCLHLLLFASISCCRHARPAFVCSSF